MISPLSLVVQSKQLVMEISIPVYVFFPKTQTRDHSCWSSAVKVTCYKEGITYEQ